MIEPPVAPPRSNPWIVLFLLLGISILSYADRYLIAGLVGPIKAEFGVGDGYIGLLMGPAFAIVFTTMAVPIARAADRRSRIAIICIGCLFWSLFTTLSGFATGPASLALARVGVGIGEAAFMAPAYSLLAAYFAPARRGLAFAVLGLGIYFGQIIGFAAGPAVAARWDWHAAFFVMGAPGVLMALLSWLYIAEPSRAGVAAATLPIGPLAKRLGGTPGYRLAVLGMGLGTLSGVSFGMWGPALFTRAYGLPAQQANTAFGLAFGLPGLVGTLLFGVLADRLLKRSPQGPMRLAAAALLAATLCIFAVDWAPEFGMARTLAIPSGLLGGGWSIGVMASLQNMLPDRFRATATALFIMISTFTGLVIGPWLAGAISETVGGSDAYGL
ncbi:MAG: MFS transporter, partial [Sandarakinorhabdus sp.]|nr:MFS transporter [Sandarakinorhabdus sp.]